jgi:phosphatidylglycerophosphate synthase
VIRQAALYCASADDVQAAGLSVAGRPVVFRALMAAVRAGARRVAVPALLRSPALDRLLTASPTARAALVWMERADTLDAEPTLLLPAASLTPPAALARLLEAPPGRILAESQANATPAVTVDATLLAALKVPLAAGAPLGDALGRELKTRDLVPVAGAGWFVRVTGDRAAAEAETRLWGELGSAIDSWLDVAVHRRLSKPLTRIALALGVRPNAITTASGLIGVLAAVSFQRGDVSSLVVGLLLYLVAVVLDHADGEVARLTLSESPIGEWLDIGTDTLVHIALVLALGIAATRLGGSGLVAGALAAAGVVASAVVGKWWPPTPPGAGPRGLLDTLTSRDGFYGMLVTFLVLRVAAPSLLPTLMAVVAAGTHGYWIARVLVLVGRRAG